MKGLFSKLGAMLLVMGGALPSQAQLSPEEKSIPVRDGSNNAQATIMPAPNSAPSLTVYVPGKEKKAKKFIGIWQLQGTRVKLEALPKFQPAAEEMFKPQWNSVWQFSNSDPDGSIQQDVQVSKDTLVVKQQQKVAKMTAEYVSELQLKDGGKAFSGVQRITIVGQEAKTPRAVITFNLVGSRQEESKN